MAEQAERRAVRDVSEIYRHELARLDRIQRRHGERLEPVDRAHPLEYDESGFPIPQRHRRLVERVARRLSPP